MPTGLSTSLRAQRSNPENGTAKEAWIASSLALLAMTAVKASLPRASSACSARSRLPGEGRDPYAAASHFGTDGRRLLLQYRIVVMGPGPRAQLRTRPGRRAILCVRALEFSNSCILHKHTLSIANIASRSRRIFRASFASIVPPSSRRGRGECRVPNAPAAPCALGVVSMHTGIHSGGTGYIRHSPRNGFTAYT